MMDALTIFIAGYVSVFALGFQSRNVNHGNYGWAAVTSAFVGVSQALLWRHILQDETLSGAAIYAVSGALGITSSMYVHERYIKNEKPKDGGTRKRHPA